MSQLEVENYVDLYCSILENKQDDIEYVKGMLCVQHNNYFKVLAENYCYKNGLPIEMADKIAWEFDKQEVKDEDK